MAIIVKYVVVADGKEDMIFSTRKEAEAHDTMLTIAERLTAFLHTAELGIADETLEALTIFMAQHRVDLGTILKGGKLQTPTTRRQPEAEPQDTRPEAEPQDPRIEVSAATPRRTRTPSSAPSAPPQAAA